MTSKYWFTRGAVVLMAHLLVGVGMLAVPHGAAAGGGTDFYYIYNNSSCAGGAMWAGRYSVPLSAGDRQVIQAQGGTHYERLSQGVCRSV